MTADWGSRRSCRSPWTNMQDMHGSSRSSNCKRESAQQTVESLWHPKLLLSVQQVELGSSTAAGYP
jgi:hypothetical protein